MTKENQMIHYLMTKITDKKKHVEFLKSGGGTTAFREIHIQDYKKEIAILLDILESVGK